MCTSKFTVGVDCGSRTTKLVVWNRDTREVAWHGHTATGVRPNVTAGELLARATTACGTDLQDAPGVATGYGRRIVGFAGRVVSEITCHARGVAHLLPQARTVVDIGGQDSKVIALQGGRVIDFAMNDRCAAGTGRFLEMLAHQLDTTVDRLGELAAASTTALEINATCVVFAESEIVGLLADGAAAPDIAAGVHRAVARRIAQMAAGLPMQAPVVFTGGVAANDGVRRALEEALGLPVQSAPWHPVLTGALGAALLAADGKES